MLNDTLVKARHSILLDSGQHKPQQVCFGLNATE